MPSGPSRGFILAPPRPSIFFPGFDAMAEERKRARPQRLHGANTGGPRICFDPRLITVGKPETVPHASTVMTRWLGRNPCPHVGGALARVGRVGSSLGESPSAGNWQAWHVRALPVPGGTELKEERGDGPLANAWPHRKCLFSTLLFACFPRCDVLGPTLNSLRPKWT